MSPRLLAPAALACLLAAPVLGQEPPQWRNPFGLPEPITAFPDIKPPERKGNKYPTLAEQFPLIIGASPRAIPADAPVRRKLQIARLNELATYLDRFDRRPQFGIDVYVEVTPAFRIWAEAGQVGADLEWSPSAKVTWFEEWLLGVKELERSTTVRVETGADQPYLLNAARAKRYMAEIDLLRMKDLAAREWNPPPRPKPSAPVTMDPDVDPFTAFPELRPPPPGKMELGVWIRGQLPRTLASPIKFEPSDDDRRRLLKARLNAGRLYLTGMWARLEIEGFSSREYPPLLAMASRVGLVGAELEQTPAGRVQCFEDRVRLAWALEHLFAARVKSGADYPWELNVARAARLAAELDLLDARVWASQFPTPPQPIHNLPVAEKDETAGFTAYPDLPPLPWDRFAPGKRADLPPELAGRMPRGEMFWTSFPNGATWEQKLGISRSNEAWVYLLRFRARIEIGAFQASEFSESLEMLPLAVWSRAEPEADPAERTRWLALGVTAAKEAERFMALRVETGADQPYQLPLARFSRLGAELALYDLEHPPRAAVPGPCLVVYPCPVVVHTCPCPPQPRCGLFRRFR